MGVAVVVLDGSHAVQVWSRDAEDLWGLRQNEVIGENFLRLDIGLPVGELRTAIRSTLLGEGRSDVVIDAMNRRGRAIRCRVTLLPLSIDSEAATGVILLMSEEGTPTPR
jgi:two-component system CheB/CheR fusion protein